MKRIRWLAIMASASLAAGYIAERLRGRNSAVLDDAERGRHAASPFEMTWLGWKDILTRTWNQTMDNRLLSIAAGVAFFTLLAIVPGLSVLISVYGLFSDPSVIARELAPVTAILPEAVQRLLEEQATRLAAESTGKLSLNLVVGLIITGWSANAAVKAIFDALNVIYNERESRSFLHFNGISMLVTISALFLLIGALVIIAVIPALLTLLPFANQLELLLGALRWPLFFLIAVIAIALLYWIGPSRRAARFVWVLPGAFIAALLWVGASGLFSWYVTTLGNYIATYGSLAAVIVFMTWLWLSASIILIGAGLNAELEHQTAHDTTHGPAKPLGERGAAMANRVGPAMNDS